MLSENYKSLNMNAFLYFFCIVNNKPDQKKVEEKKWIKYQQINLENTCLIR